jgi:hypothetical protein
MVRRCTARALKLNEETVCVNVSGLLVENRSPGLDDDPRVLVLINRTVTRTFINIRFSDTPLDCSVVSFFAQQTLVELNFAKASPS